MTNENAATIGTVVHFNKAGYDSYMSAWHKVKTSINELAAVYLRLDIGDFNKEILRDLYHHGSKNIYESKRSAMRIKLEKSGLLDESTEEPFMKSLVDPGIGKLDLQTEQVKKVIESVNLPTTSKIRSVQIEEFEIVNNQVVLSDYVKEKIKADCSITLDSDKKVEFYNDYLKLKSVFDAFVDDHVKAHSFKSLLEIVSNSHYSVFTTDQDKHLVLQLGTIAWIK